MNRKVPDMRTQAKIAMGGGDGPDFRTLEMLLDYAIMEGTDLRLPLFVLLLRAAQLELITQAGPGNGLHESSHEAKIGECLSAVECRSVADLVPERCIEVARDVLHGPQPVIHDR